MKQLQFAFIGLTISSSWGNGHATTFRSLIKGLNRAGHKITFYERDVYWYAGIHRDMPDPSICDLVFYDDLKDLQRRQNDIANADVTIVGSFVPEGIAVGDWVLSTARGLKAFYDIDTPVTIARLENGDCDYLSASQISQYDLYLSITDGSLLQLLMKKYKSPRALLFPCSVDPDLYHPEPIGKKWDLGYMGTYSDCRQPPLERLLVAPARRFTDGRFVVAGSLYPEHISWPANVDRIEHLPPANHREFYNSQRFTLNLTRQEMIRAGHSPSVRIFEAAACGVPIISDKWSGIERYFKDGEEILLANNPEDTLRFLRTIDDEESAHIGMKAREKILKRHTGERRAQQLVAYINEPSMIDSL